MLGSICIVREKARRVAYTGWTSWYREHEARQFCIFYLMHMIHGNLMASNAVQ